MYQDNSHHQEVPWSIPIEFGFDITELQSTAHVALSFLTKLVSVSLREAMSHMYAWLT